MKRVGVFYSVGPHFRTALKTARTLGDRVIAIVPPHLEFEGETEGLIDETIRTEREHYSPRDVAACRRLLRQINDAKLDKFVVLFDSPQLKLLAALVEARKVYYCAPHGYVRRLDRSAARVVAAEMAIRARGWLRYAWLSILVRATPITPEPSPDRTAAPRR